MSNYVNQSGLAGELPVVANHLNIPKPAAGKPTLLTWDEVTTMFHEFGHALHGLFSNVRYPTFSGTSTPTDFVEYPSQVTRCGPTWPQVLGHYARHYQTASRCRANCWTRCWRRRSSTRASRPRPMSAPRCWTSAGTSSPRARRPRRRA